VALRDVEATLAPELNTVVQLSWTSDQPGRSWAEYRVDGGALAQASSVSAYGQEHRVDLMGLRSFAEVDFEVFTEGSDFISSEQGAIVTGGIPSGIPEVEVSQLQPELVSPDRFLLVAMVGLEDWVLVLDRAGEVVWYLGMHEDWSDRRLMNACFTVDGQGLLYGVNGFHAGTAEGRAVWVDPLAVVLDSITIGVAHHGVEELPDGSIAVLQGDTRAWYDPDRGQEVQVTGDALTVYAPDGGSETLFSTWDWREPEVHDRFYDAVDGVGDWTHGNGVSYDPGSESYLLSLGFVDTVLQVSAERGEPMREFGPLGYPVEQGQPFEFQHGPHWTDDGGLLMSSTIPGSHGVMAIEYEVDDDRQQLSERWSYGADQGFDSSAGGQAIRLSNGNTLLNTGYSGLLIEVTPGGEPVWEMSAALGAVFASVVFFDAFPVGG